MTIFNPGYGLLGRLGSEPMLIAPNFTGLGETVSTMLAEKEGPKQDYLTTYAALFGDDRAERKPYAFAGGMAIIPVHGTLINRFNGTWGFVTGYDYIRGAFDAALGDSAVQGIVLDVDSYGGEVHGCFELSDHIYANRGKKPVRSFVNANCYSAAYATASAADSISVTPSGGAGSIGVVTMHVDYSKALKENGIQVSFIYAGKHKVDGNPYQPLPDDVRADIQARIDTTYEKFVATVARNRGLDAKKVKGTEARTYGADEAKKNGLIDRVAAPTASYASFANELSGSPSQEFDEMTTPVNTENAEGGMPEVAAAAPVAAPAAAAPEAPAVVADAPAAAAAPTERERIKAILESPEAKERADLANHLALNTDLGVDAAVAILAAAPAAKPAAANAFAAAMAHGNPEVSAESGEGESQPVSTAKRVADAYAAATGRRLDQ
jgi:signal peptide peptidase SppA